MRYVFGSMVTAAAMMAAGSAHATDAPVLPLSLAVADIAVAPEPEEASFRLPELTAVQSAAPRVSLDDDASRLRRGYGASMVSFFPLGGDGFHIGAGTRFWSRGTMRPSVEPVYQRLLYAPRNMLVRASRRMTPALTAGYSRIVGAGMTLGVEGGAMLGKFDTLAGALVHPPRLRGDASDGAGRLNQVARATLGWHF